jgi:hypothetical protein
MIKANSISEVLCHLDNIIAWSKDNKSRIGYFASLYRKMTVAVQQGIINNSFHDGKRMEQLDVIFANRYLHAWEAYVGKQKCTNAWCAAFDACKRDNLVVLQHLVLGINTHINLDLGIAAAETSPGDKIYALEKDFNKINDVIASLTQQVQNTLSNIWFPLRFLTKIANNRQEPVLNFSIGAARKASWINAVALSLADESTKANYINKMDEKVVVLAKRITTPGNAVKFFLKPVLLMESKNIPAIIDILQK